MKTARLWALCAVAWGVLLPIAALAEHKGIQGRTGLPVVLEGKQNVWMNRGEVRIELAGNSMNVIQDFKLNYPGAPLEKGVQTIKVGVREDYYRAIDNGAPKVTENEAKGFSAFAVYVDGRAVKSGMEPWKENHKADTATRWRTWEMSFAPGQSRNMKIIARSPLGYESNRRFVQFVTKDLGHWRGAPDVLEIRFSAPGDMETKVAGLEPKPKDINSRAIRWVYRKSSPNRDIYVQLPPEYGKRSASR
jgi:hypothetical protein